MKNLKERRPVTGSSLRRRALCNILGAVMLAMGIVSAGMVIWNEQSRSARRSGTSSSDSGWKDDSLSSEDSKTSTRQSEMLVGKVGALIAYWWRRSTELASPEGVAMMFAMISVLAAFGCFFFADRL
jgi:hypothetical protein